MFHIQGVFKGSVKNPITVLKTQGTPREAQTN